MNKDALFEFDCGDTILIKDMWSDFRVKGLFMHHNDSSIYFIDVINPLVAPIRHLDFVIVREMSINTTRMVLTEKYVLRHYEKYVPKVILYIEEKMRERKVIKQQM